MAVALEPIAARHRPRSSRDVFERIRTELFGSWSSGIATLMFVGLLGWWLPSLIDWAVLRAVIAPNLDACHAARGSGACWGAVVEKCRLIIFGRYPYDQQWRPLAATGVLLALVVASCVRALWGRWLAWAWPAVLAAFLVLMAGGAFGLARVPTDRWGGLPLTIMLSTFSIALAFPLSVLVALGRRSAMPAIRTLCAVYVELVRGVPLISVLFMASFMIPLLLPPGWSIDVLLRVLAGNTLFAAAYLAEVVRGGLQAVPSGQIEAAASLGLSYWQTQRKIVLPQALAIVVPGIVNSFIATFKDTSLVTIVSLYELTGSFGLAFDSDADWRPYKSEGSLFIAAIYFAFCFSMSRYSLWVERQLARGRERG
jgi:general L-amino acid transport system permease protein